MSSITRRETWATNNMYFTRRPMIENKRKDLAIASELVGYLESKDSMGIKEIEQSLFNVTSYQTRQLLSECIKAHNDYYDKLNTLKGELL